MILQHNSDFVPFPFKATYAGGTDFVDNKAQFERSLLERLKAEARQRGEDAASVKLPPIHYTDFALTGDQAGRLEEIKGLPGISLDEVTAYVRDGAEPEALSYRLRKIHRKTRTLDEAYAEMDHAALTLEELKEAKIGQLNDLCRSSIYAGFQHRLGFFGFKEHDQDNFTQYMVLVIADKDVNAIQEISWKTKDRGVIQITKAEFREIVMASAAHKLNYQNIYWEKELAVLSATTKAEVDAISWE